MNKKVTVFGFLFLLIVVSAVPAFAGGRWWIDANNNNAMDAEDVFFLCPLLGPGRTTELN